MNVDQIQVAGYFLLMFSGLLLFSVDLFRFVHGWLQELPFLD